MTPDERRDDLIARLRRAAKAHPRLRPLLTSAAEELYLLALLVIVARGAYD